MVTLDTSFFTLVIMFMFLLILEQIYSIWSCKDRWQSIINPWYLTLKEWSRGWPGKTIGRWRLEFNFCLDLKIMSFVLVKFNVNLFAQSQTYILGSSILIWWIRLSRSLPHTVSEVSSAKRRVEQYEEVPVGGGDFHMEQTGMLVGNFEFNP